MTPISCCEPAQIQTGAGSISTTVIPLITPEKTELFNTMQKNRCYFKFNSICCFEVNIICVEPEYWTTFTVLIQCAKNMWVCPLLMQGSWGTFLQNYSIFYQFFKFSLWNMSIPDSKLETHILYLLSWINAYFIICIARSSVYQLAFFVSHSEINLRLITWLI